MTVEANAWRVLWLGGGQEGAGRSGLSFRAVVTGVALDCGESASASPLWVGARNPAAKAAPIPPTVRMDGWMDSEQDAPCTVWSGTLQLRRVAGDGLPAIESGDGSPQSKARQFIESGAKLQVVG